MVVSLSASALLCHLCSLNLPSSIIVIAFFLEFLEFFDRIVHICILKQRLSCFGVLFLELLHMFLQGRSQEIRTRSRPENNFCKSILHYFSVCQTATPQNSLSIPIFIISCYLQESPRYVTNDTVLIHMISQNCIKQQRFEST